MVAGLRALLPDRSLLSRRGSARRSPARLHPARRRDELRRARGRARRQRADDRPRLRPRRRPGDRAADPSASPTTTRWPAIGTDRPDLRFGLELVDLGTALAGTEFKVFAGALGSGGVIKGLNAGKQEMPRSALDGLIERAQELGAKGLVWAFREGDGWRSPTAKFLSRRGAERAERAARRRGGRPPPARRRRAKVANAVLAQLRLDLGERFGLIDESQDAFCWVVDWPLFERNEDAGSLGRRPSPVHGARRRFRPGAIPARRARRPTTSSGTARSSAAARSESPIPSCRHRSSASSGWTSEEAEARFGFLLEALRYGAPPHGGIAYGHRSLRPAARPRALDPRRDRLPQGRLGRRSPDRRPGARRRAAAARTRPGAQPAAESSRRSACLGAAVSAAQAFVAEAPKEVATDGFAW